jgi:hypothetical protein
MQVLASLMGVNNQFLVSAFDLAELAQPADVEKLLQSFPLITQKL